MEFPDTNIESSGRLHQQLVDTTGEIRGVRVQLTSGPGDVLGTLIAEPAGSFGAISEEIDEAFGSSSGFTVWLPVRASSVDPGLAGALSEAVDETGRARSSVVVEVWDLDLDDPEVQAHLTGLIDAGFGVALPLDRPDLGAIVGLDGAPVTDVSLDLAALDRLGDLAVEAVRSIQSLAHDVGFGVLHRHLPDSVRLTDLEPSDRLLVVEDDAATGSPAASSPDEPAP